MEDEQLLPHLVSEFLTWVWYTSEQPRNARVLGEALAEVDFWVDDRISFREVSSDKVCAVVTGESPSTAPEARAALGGGKVLRALRIGLRSQDREFYATLQGPYVDLAAVKLPQMITGLEDEILYDRMALYEELQQMLAALFQAYALDRTSPTWTTDVLPAIRQWVAGAAS